MSWQVYVDSNLVGSGKVDKAAILGLQGGVWATSPGFALSQEEQKAAIGAFSDPARTQATGIRLVGKKYFTLQATPDHAYGKAQADGCVLVKTKQAVIVATYVAPTQQTEATIVVEGVGDYLKSVGY